MRKDQKGTIVEGLAENLGRASIALISEYKGMTAARVLMSRASSAVISARPEVCVRR